MKITDPMEKIIASALKKSKIPFITNAVMENTKTLDFYLPHYDVYIECKQFHSDRISEQIKHADNVIVIQGINAANFFAKIMDKP